MASLELPQVAEQDLNRIRHAFGLDAIQAVAYLVQGLMNRNWQVTTQNGRYAVKQLLDVPVPTARRNLRVVAALHERGIPACRPALTSEGDTVIEIDDRGYCVLPWLDGTHPAGPDLTREQAHQLGVVVGRIHQELNDPGAATGLPVVTAPSAPVVAPADAIAEARRFQAAASAAGEPFDGTVIELLDRRIALINRYAAARPTDDSPEGPYGWTHGDLQYRNIIWAGGSIGAVIDWDRIRIRPFAQEIARTATIQFATPDGLDLDRVSAFIAGYRCMIPIADGDLIDGFHRLWWTRMSNFWQLVYHYDRGNDSCDDLFVSGEELLHWWTCHSTEVHDAVRCGA